MLLTQLAACPNIRIVASIDHANAMMLWDMQMLSTLKWSMHNITTYAPYTEETMQMSCLIAGKIYHNQIYLQCFVVCKPRILPQENLSSYQSVNVYTLMFQITFSSSTQSISLC